MADLRRSLIMNFFSSSGAAFMQFVVSVLLARILSSSEIGVYSMTVVFVNLAHVFRDFGVSSYLGFGPMPLAQALWPSAVVAGGCAAAGWMLDMLVPDMLGPLARLLVMPPLLAGVWYVLLRLTRHAMLDEVHRLAGVARTRLALLRPTV